MGSGSFIQETPCNIKQRAYSALLETKHTPYREFCNSPNLKAFFSKPCLTFLPLFFWQELGSLHEALTDAEQAADGCGAMVVVAASMGAWRPGQDILGFFVFCE